MKRPLRILLADPVHTFVGGRDNWYIPLSVLYIQSTLLERFAGRVEVEVFKFPERMFEAIDRAPPDMIGVSNYVWNHAVGVALLAHARKANPDAVTVMGGPNATLTAPRMTELFKRAPVDYYVSADGERPFAALVEARLAGLRPLHAHPDVHGIWYPDEDGRAREIPTRPWEDKTLDGIPSPFQSGLADPFFEDGLGAMIETNRGCPFHCTFCVWGNGSKVLQFSVERVKADLEHCSRKAKQELLMMNDANFGLFRNRDLEIARHIRTLKETRGWPVSMVVNWGQVRSEASITVADTLKGITLLRQSSQSMSQEVLETIHRNNVPDEQWRRTARECRELGIDSFAELIVMLPKETQESYLTGLRYFFDLGINSINTNQCQLLEGAAMNTPEQREQYGLKTRWRLLENAYGTYSGHICLEAEEVVVETSTFSFEENLMCRMLNWLIQMSWTLRRHDLLLRLLQEWGLSPVDFLMQVMREKELAAPAVQALFDAFDADARAELFPSREALNAHWGTPERMEELRQGGFRKLNTHYSALGLMHNEDFIAHYVALACEAAPGLPGTPAGHEEMIRQCARFLSLRTVDMDALEASEAGFPPSRQAGFDWDFAAWSHDPDARPLTDFHRPARLSFQMDAEQNAALRYHMQSLAHKGREYQMRKLHEPFYGIRKEHLLFRVAKDQSEPACSAPVF